ncbi:MULTISPECIES: PIN domain-containing protein [unclassified Streptomyces]|uniref:PIN domain-containing protein n=1 Tax=unclassified Streptomyces TaxID=2593676 RepID=UPI001C48667B|nr:PIN domain-containing protein [Streptomyces sp. MW-W600-10]MBV7245704.1 DUF4935 domain-containing protein [Streptomyces sp. MW-W600-10]
MLDTNAILNLYRMKKSARNEYLQVLQKIEARVWIPRQVADEFHKNRLSTVDSHVNSLKGKSETVSESAESFRSALRDFFKLHSLADGRSSDYLKPLNDSISDIVGSVKREVEEYDLKASDLLSGDPVLARLSSLFDGKVGLGIPAEDLKGAAAEALRRAEEEIPPGYKDAQSKGEKGVGDYFIWREVIDHAKTTKRDILFVSTDMKDDWVRKQCGFSIGPRPELVQEMRNLAGVAYHHLPLAVFLSRAADVLEVQVSQDTINQVKDRSISTEKKDLKKEIRRWQEVFDSSEKKMMEFHYATISLREKISMAEREAATARHRVNHMRTSHPDSKNFIAELAAAEDNLRRTVSEFEAARDSLTAAERENVLIGERLRMTQERLEFG